MSDLHPAPRKWGIIELRLSHKVCEGNITMKSYYPDGMGVNYYLNKPSLVFQNLFASTIIIYDVLLSLYKALRMN